MGNDTCSIDGCGSRPFCRGWCSKHYSRWQRHGDPLIETRSPPLAPDATEKVCPRCGQTKLLRFFASRKRGDLALKGYCRECEAHYSAVRLAGSAEARQARRAASAAWNKRNRGAALRRLYGITESDYAAMVQHQNGRCAICDGNEVGGNGRHWHVDHDHATGRVRGLLCHRCNMGLGYFKDDPVRLAAALRYLQPAT